MSKRKMNNSDDPIDYFKIEDYKITNIDSFLNMIIDLENKAEPPRKIRNKLPTNIYKLIDILEPLIKLNNLIGMTKLKEQLLEQLLYFIQGHDDIIMLHTVIEGPPGTGKTTVANLMAEIYSGMGILKKNKCTIIKRDDLIGQFLGETSIKTMAVLNRCKNGVVLIDEAYSLGSGSSSSTDSYAKEAIDCINQFLTENVDKIICIIAGYKNELDTCFFSQNPGLRRRFPWTFTIDDFTEKELSEVTIKLIKESDWETTCSSEEIEKFIKKDCFNGNGGDIESVISRAKIIYSKVNFGKENDYILTFDILKEAFQKFCDTKKGQMSSPPPFMMYN
tara:strand:+ start:91 stop:1092 length:1002 start_codon:yes stop_codon:yes gene_type:complete